MCFSILEKRGIKCDAKIFQFAFRVAWGFGVLYAPITLFVKPETDKREEGFSIALMVIGSIILLLNIGSVSRGIYPKEPDAMQTLNQMLMLVYLILLGFAIANL